MFSLPNFLQMARLRGLLDHCPLLIMVDEQYRGPRPSRMLKCWKDILGYKHFVSNKRKTLQVDRRGGFVLKGKLKLIKLALKEWNVTHTHNLLGKIDSPQRHLSVLDFKWEEEVLSEAEIAEMHGITSIIHSLFRINISLCWQQSRLLWLRERDANSKYFHSVLASRRRRNTISAIMVDGVMVKGMTHIIKVVVSHFVSHFRASNVERPGVGNLQFQTLSLMEGGSLIKPFSLDEVKVAVWDCDSYKSSGPDGINIGFC